MLEFTQVNIKLETEDGTLKNTGELDLLILDNQNKILFVGECKTSIDDVAKAYYQLQKIQEAFYYNISKLRFYLDSSKEFVKLELNDNLIQAIQQNIDRVENNLYFNIITKNQEIGDFDLSFISNFLTILTKFNIIKLKDDHFIVSDTIKLDDIEQVKDLLNSKLLSNEIIFTSDILKKYLGKKNLMIFKEIVKLENAYNLLNRYFIDY